MIRPDLMVSTEAPSLFKVGEAMLAGEIEYRKGNFDVAFEHLREAVRCVTNKRIRVVYQPLPPVVALEQSGRLTCVRNLGHIGRARLCHHHLSQAFAESHHVAHAIDFIIFLRKALQYRLLDILR